MNEGVGVVTIPVRLSVASSQNVFVSFSTAGDATNSQDYTLSSSTITIPAGSLSGVISFPVADDSLDEADETVKITLNQPDNTLLGTPNVHTVTIQDNDLAPVIAFSSPTYTVQEGNTTATITVTLSAPSALNVSVPYATSNITATAGTDYITSTGTIFFSPDQVTQTFAVPIKDDLIYEGDETVRLSLGTPTNGTVPPPGSAILTIKDNERLPKVSFTSSRYSVVEGQLATITVTLDVASAVTTVDVSTLLTSTATISDYTPITTTLRFNNTLTETFTISTTDDTMTEHTEKVLLNLSNARNAEIGAPNPTTLAILDNDIAPFQFTVDSFSVEESNADKYPITIHISPTLGVSTTLHVSTDVLTSTNAITNAEANIDYEPLLNKEIILAPYTSAITIPLMIKDDSQEEPNEGIRLIVTDDMGRSSTATVIIIDDDKIFDDPCPTTTYTETTVLLTDTLIETQNDIDIDVDCNHALIINASTKPIIITKSITTTNPFYDLAYGEAFTDNNALSSALDWMVIQVAENENGPWYTVFYWGDGLPDNNAYFMPDNPLDQGNIMTTFRESDGSERENLRLPLGKILIDIDQRAPAGTYNYIRIISPKGGSAQSVDADMVKVLTPADRQPTPAPVGNAPAALLAAASRRVEVDELAMMRGNGAY